jgi:hypothetical protein
MRLTWRPGEGSTGRARRRLPRRSQAVLECRGRTLMDDPSTPLTPTHAVGIAQRRTVGKRGRSSRTTCTPSSRLETCGPRTVAKRSSSAPTSRPLVWDVAFTPANAPLDQAVVPVLAAANLSERRVRDVLMGRGYSQLGETELHHPLRRAGMLVGRLGGGVFSEPPDLRGCAQPTSTHRLRRVEPTAGHRPF